MFDANATGSLAPFNGMFVVGTHEEDPNVKGATIRLWEWESGIPLLTSGNTTASMGESLPPSPSTMKHKRLMENNSNDNSGRRESILEISDLDDLKDI